ncbi:MAG: hypothetical protein RL456_2146 [Pseudomonadota bacterium]|jgi:hypothetical protein
MSAARDPAEDDDESPAYEVDPDVRPPMTPLAHRVAAILWPAFLMAGVIEMLVFAMVDPADLHWLGGASLDLDRKGVYTLSFFAFWGIVATAAALTQLILTEPRGGHAPRQRVFP